MGRYRRSYSSGNSLLEWLYLGFLAVVFSGMFFFFGLQIRNGFCQFDITHETIHATKVETIGGQGGENFVYTDKMETFIVEDSWIEWWNGNEMGVRSRDRAGTLFANKCYDVKLRGERWPFWSFHRNIITAQEVPCADTPSQ